MRARPRAEPTIRRLLGPADAIPLQTGHTVYEITLSAVPSRAWRAAFIRPPARLRTARYTPDAISLHGTTVIFRTTLSRLPSWLRRLDRWIAYANSVVAE